MSYARDPLGVPEPLRPHAEAIFQVTDPFCAEHLDAEYGKLVRRLVAKLARKRPSPITRGDLRIWAAAAIYTMAGVNFLFDKSQRPHRTAAELCALLGVSQSTVANKARLIRDLLGIGPMEPEFCRRALLESNPMASMILIDGFLVDVRALPPEIQAEVRRRGLVPYLPDPAAPDDGETASGGEARG